MTMKDAHVCLPWKQQLLNQCPELGSEVLEKPNAHEEQSLWSNIKSLESILNLLWPGTTMNHSIID